MDLKSFREDKLKITQSAFAKLIGVEQSSISEWEKNPDSISLSVIQKILEKTGVSYEELTGWEKPIPKPLDVNNTWEKANYLTIFRLRLEIRIFQMNNYKHMSKI